MTISNYESVHNANIRDVQIGGQTDGITTEKAKQYGYFPLSEYDPQTAVRINELLNGRSTDVFTEPSPLLADTVEVTPSALKPAKRINKQAETVGKEMIPGVKEITRVMSHGKPGRKDVQI